MITLKDSIEIRADADEVFAQLVEYLSDRESYQSWHPEHVDLRWIKGEPLQVGSIMCAEEYLHGYLHTLKFRVTKVVPSELISYRPLFPLSIIATGNTFRFEPNGDRCCIFTADGHIRFPLWLFKKMHKNHEGKLVASKQHMKEEGENLKKKVEKERAV